MLLKRTAQPRAQNLHARRGDVNFLCAIVGEGSKLIVTVERRDADDVRQIVACRIVWRAVCIRARIAAGGDEEDALFARFTNGIFERTGFLRRAPTGADDPHRDARALAIYDVVDGLYRILGRAGAPGPYELQGHDLDFPVDARDPHIVIAFGSDDSGTVRAVAVVVHRVGEIVNSTEPAQVIDRAELIVHVLIDIGRSEPDIFHEVWMRVIDAAVEHGDDHLLAAFRLVPGEQVADVRLSLSAVLPCIIQ